MKQDWYNLRYNFLGSDYDLPWLVDFYMKQASFIAYKNIEAIRNYLVIFDFEVPEMIEDYLENSEHQNINPGQKRSSSAKKLMKRDYLAERPQGMLKTSLLKNAIFLKQRSGALLITPDLFSLVS